MPEGAIYVGRPTRWGNPFSVGCWAGILCRPVQDAEEAAILFQLHCDWRTGTHVGAPSVYTELRGKDLACWCPLEDKYGNPVPCHADVLLEWANAVG